MQSKFLLKHDAVPKIHSSVNTDNSSIKISEEEEQLQHNSIDEVN